MIRLVRRMGIAFGSLVAAALCLSLLNSLDPSFTATTPVVTLPSALFVAGPSAGGAVLTLFATIVLGGLIYRDILIREAQRI